MKYFLPLFLVACGSTQSGSDGGSDGAVVDTGHPSPCGMVDIDGLKIASLDPLGYPPYAAGACQLAYVAKDGSLVLRDLKTSSELVVVDVAEKPRRPSLAGSILAWEATLGGIDVVRWRNAAGAVETIASTSARAGEPHAAPDAIAFTGWTTLDMKGDTDVFLFSTSDKSIVPIGDGPAQQRFADINATHMAWSDFSEAGPTGAFDAGSTMGFDAADVVVFDRVTKTKLTRKIPNKQAFPMLVAGGSIAYLDWNAVRPQPKLWGYGFRVGAITADPGLDANIARSDTIETNVPYIRPSVRGDSFVWIETGGLWLRPTNLSVAPQRVDSFAADAYGVVAIDGLAIVAVGPIADLSLLGLKL